MHGHSIRNLIPGCKKVTVVFDSSGLVDFALYALIVYKPSKVFSIICAGEKSSRGLTQPCENDCLTSTS